MGRCRDDEITCGTNKYAAYYVFSVDVEVVLYACFIQQSIRIVLSFHTNHPIIAILFVVVASKYIVRYLSLIHI